MKLVLIDHWGGPSAFPIPLGDDSALGDWKANDHVWGIIKTNLSSKALWLLCPSFIVFPSLSLAVFLTFSHHLTIPHFQIIPPHRLNTRLSDGEVHFVKESLSTHSRSPLAGP